MPPHCTERTTREVETGETAAAFAAMRELRTGLADEAEFVRRVDELQRPAGYRLAGAFLDGPDAVAVAGFRISDNLAWGRHLYLDDLSTAAAHRGRGHAGALLDWLIEEARHAGCEQIHLDSGVGLERAAAHRLYLNHSFVISSHHFARAVSH